MTNAIPFPFFSHRFSIAVHYFPEFWPMQHQLWDLILIRYKCRRILAFSIEALCTCFHVVTKVQKRFTNHPMRRCTETLLLHTRNWYAHNPPMHRCTEFLLSRQTQLICSWTILRKNLLYSSETIIALMQIIAFETHNFLSRHCYPFITMLFSLWYCYGWLTMCPFRWVTVNNVALNLIKQL